MKSKFEASIELPVEVTASLAAEVLTLKGPKGEIARKLADPLLKMLVDGNKVVLSCAKGTKRQKRMMNTFEAHINNMILGVQTPYKYLLKICSGHFPMNVSVTGDQLIVKNFLGEKSPRTLKLKKGVTVKVEGDNLLVESSDKDLAGQMASDIELLTAKRNRDLRVFQDGIYMIEKAGKAW
ncbi:MAG TPA: 50S ribosomal protein L6 [Candidatus Nanoarchaeia archaeon]|nr:50S ribosomal protein L6 [Candidatus Nanoarchaeia archaeon]